MKTMKRLAALCLALAMLAGGAALAAEAEDIPRIILFTCYTNLHPDGLELQAGCVDEDGGLWTLELADADLTGCASIGEFLWVMRRAGKLVYAGEIQGIDDFELKSLVVSAEDQGHELEAVADGGGGEISYAVAWDVDGNAREILLGASGDSKFENTDPNAQALYLLLRKFFPNVKNAAYSDAGPRGFRPVPVIEFCGWQDVDFDHAVMECYLEDCEEGLIPVKPEDYDREEIIGMITGWNVVGKANATLLTGGPVTYLFRDGEGNYLASLSLYHGLLVMGDGMYYISGQ